MNKAIMKQAIERVQRMFSPSDAVCAVCRKNKIDYSENEGIDIKGMPTEVGIPTCKSCFDNIQIVIGEISDEY